jgi:hypothetical protein
MKIKKNAAKAVVMPNVKTSGDFSAPAPTTNNPQTSTAPVAEPKSAAARPSAAAAAEPKPAPARPSQASFAESKPAAAAKPSPSAASSASGAVTVIDVKHDVGFGNALFLRGQGGGLNWERGVQMDCVDGKTWRWSAKVKDPLTFKLLINDQIWSTGNDLIVKPGQKLEVNPSFS